LQTNSGIHPLQDTRRRTTSSRARHFLSYWIVFLNTSYRTVVRLIIRLPTT
jgi:hypothetical protein